MRYFIILITAVLILSGCSQATNNPAMPGSSESQIYSTETESNIFYSGTFEIDLETQQIIQIENRQSDLVYNITGFLPTKCPGGCFRFKIIGIIGTVLEIELTLENPLTIQIYDARVVYVDLFGKEVLNPDSYSDFKGTPITRIFPFTAFMKELESRAFPVGPGGIDTEILYLNFPPGSIAAVNYMITAGYPNQIQEPYEINSMSQTGQLSESGGSALISCAVKDHQNDVSSVFMDSRPFVGTYSAMTQSLTNPGTWEVNISNNLHAPVGSYNQLIKASSPNSQNISTYNYVEITVSGSGQDNPIAIIETTPNPPTVSVMNPLVIFDGSDSYDPDGGPITLYEWDFDYSGDPSEFDPDLVGMDATVTQDYHCITGTHLVALRVTDDDIPAGVSEIASVEVNVIDDRPTGSWEGSEELGNEWIDGDFLYVTGQMLQVDSIGRTHIITRGYDNVARRYFINRRTFDGSTISAPTQVPGTPDYFNMVTSVMDNNDELHLFWFAYDTNESLYHTQTVDGAFTGNVEVLCTESRANYMYEMMNVCKNVNGDIMVTWLDYDWDKVDPHFMFTMNDGSGFTTPANIPYLINMRSSAGPNPGYINLAPNLVSTPDGKFHQIFYAYDGDLSYNVVIFDIVFDGSNWDTPRKAFDPAYTSGTPYDISVAAGPDGNIHVTGPWSAGNMAYVRYDSQSDTWQDAITVAANSSNMPYGAVEVDDYGFVHLVYAANDGYLRLKVFCQYADEASILALPDSIIDSSTRSNDHNQADLQWDHDGNLMALYQDSRDDTYTYFNRFMY
jgi:hypothetical protein